MIMITGGAYSGRREFAKQRFGLTDGDILDGGSCDLSAVKNAKCVCNYELAVKRLIENGTDPLGFTGSVNCGIVIMNEIGCGIIPLEKSEREWRETAGRADCMIAAKSDTVYRVCCGIAAVIKGEKQ